MLSFVIPYGRSDPRRDRILSWLLAYYARHFRHAEFIVSRDESEPFCKSRALNLGVARAHGDNLVLLDADILVDPQALKGWLGYGSWAVPDTNVRDLAGRATSDILGEEAKGFVFRRLSGMDLKRKRAKAGGGRGGVIVVRRSVFNRAGGYDERFKGWGGEDICFFLAANTICGPPHLMTGLEIYHLEHPANRVQRPESDAVGRQYVEVAGDPEAMGEVVESGIPSLDFFSWLPWYTDHLVPIWQALPEKARGDFFLCQDDSRISEEHKRLYLSPELAAGELGESDTPLVITSLAASFVQGIKRPLIRAYHGAGQIYIGSGGWPRHNVALDLAPNESSANAVRREDPGAKVAVTGCPKIDRWAKVGIKAREDPPVVAVSFHFDLKFVPESRTAWPHYKRVLESLAASGYEILGHGHPRMIGELEPHYKKYGIEVVRDFEEVLDRADLYCCDHMSTLYEFAFTGRPVVVLNAPWYRRDVEHGLRFWEYADVGVNCDEPGDLLESIALALEDRPEQRKARERAVKAVFPYRGIAARVAAQEIISLGGVSVSLTPGGCMRVRVTNPGTSTIARGGMVFRGGTTNEVVLSDGMSLREIRACRMLTIEVLEDKMIPAPTNEPCTETPDPERFICGCGFVAKNKAGLSAHKRRCK